MLLVVFGSIAVRDWMLLVFWFAMTQIDEVCTRILLRTYDDPLYFIFEVHHNLFLPYRKGVKSPASYFLLL